MHSVCVCVYVLANPLLATRASGQKKHPPPTRQIPGVVGWVTKKLMATEAEVLNQPNDDDDENQRPRAPYITPSSNRLVLSYLSRLPAVVCAAYSQPRSLAKTRRETRGGKEWETGGRKTVCNCSRGDDLDTGHEPLINAPPELTNPKHQTNKLCAYQTDTPACLHSLVRLSSLLLLRATAQCHLCHMKVCLPVPRHGASHPITPPMFSW